MHPPKGGAASETGPVGLRSPASPLSKILMFSRFLSFRRKSEEELAAGGLSCSGWNLLFWQCNVECKSPAQLGSAMAVFAKKGVSPKNLKILDSLSVIAAF